MKKYKLTGPRIGMMIAIGTLLTALWLVAAYGTYMESQREKYDIHVSPGVVSYGTHSTATMPMVSTPSRQRMPMVSGGEVRSYAHHGHASMPAETVSASKGLYATSSATVTNIGSGMGTGISMSASTGTSSAPSRGIIYGSGNYAVMPTLALATTPRRSATSEQTAMMSPIRRVKGDGTGEYDGEYYNGLWWSEDAEKWVSDPFEGCVKIVGGWYCVYNGYGWVQISPVPDIGAPIGDAPWLVLLMLLMAYALAKSLRITKKAS